MVAPTSLSKLPAVLIIGPTGAGKTAAAYELSRLFPAHIINADVGQFYTDLRIGTATPAWENSEQRHFLFSVLNSTSEYNVTCFRTAVENILNDPTLKESTPLIVGGSTFYLYSLIFKIFKPPHSPLIEIESALERGALNSQEETKENGYIWKKLQIIDPQRAACIHPHDTYRIKKALDLWHTHGVLPSSRAPVFDPITRPLLIVHLSYEKKYLKEVVKKRVIAMLSQGWLEEVKELLGTPWEELWQRKKIIGYKAVADFLRSEQSASQHEALIETIVQETMAYVKKQEKYWRMLVRRIQPYTEYIVYHHLDLTSLSSDLYLEQLLYINSLLVRLRI